MTIPGSPGPDQAPTGRSGRWLYRGPEHPHRPAVRPRLPPLPPHPGGRCAAGSVYLGRPWRPSSAFPDGRYGDPRFVAAAAFLDCWMDDHIAPAGWTEMWYTGKDGNPRTMLQPEEVRFSHYGSRGPGAAVFGRSATLTRDEARRLTRTAVIGDLGAGRAAGRTGQSRPWPPLAPDGRQDPERLAQRPAPSASAGSGRPLRARASYRPYRLPAGESWHQAALKGHRIMLGI